LINKVWISTCGWYSMLAVVYIFFFLLLVDLVRLLDKYLRFVPNVMPLPFRPAFWSATNSTS
ncbi:MAG: metallophosphoesterase, partial [Bacillota bacterium]|nr:metallophosphoesterase [Bacillota bacterium]